jgi:hypothetical protein
MFGDSVPQHRVAQGFDYMMTVQPASHTNRQAFTRVLVDQGQQPQAPSIVCARLDEVVTPYRIGPFGPQPDAASVVQPQSSSWLLLGRNLQSFAPPDALHTISAYIPSSILQKPGDAAVAVAAILGGQRQDRLRQHIFIFAPKWLIALFPARLVDQSARPPLAHPLPAGVLDGRPAPFGT